MVVAAAAAAWSGVANASAFDGVVRLRPSVLPPPTGHKSRPGSGPRGPLPGVPTAPPPSWPPAGAGGGPSS